MHTLGEAAAVAAECAAADASFADEIHRYDKSYAKCHAKLALWLALRQRASGKPGGRRAAGGGVLPAASVITIHLLRICQVFLSRVFSSIS